ncbi:zinc ABC transporter substrate-binding protein [Ruegeria arenilitoris]|uniref:zinc ABC transporter substrate-binding protein n=1 Tax=Ruegeria arenilitoris TaxID=1173585 RepID=UPI001C94A80D|nr:zinc ABC transporter substrate-binding protein [Ruegeria arenilitoris]MBY6081885.1 zinc ABC transporter substrate-binding protein [Ruegeria arenilitoris]
MSRKFLLLAGVVLAGKAAADAPSVAVDIAPVHALVAQVMDGVAEPSLIIPPGASPHDHAMRPSEARALQSADVVFWVGPEMTSWLTDPLGALSEGATQVELLEVAGTVRHDFRDLADHHEGEEEHADHDDHSDHDDHDDHEDHADHAEHDDHAGHDEHADHDEHEKHEEHADHDAHDDDHGHDHDGVDPHAWLDPENARVWVQAIAKTLSEKDPDNAARYQANADKAVEGLSALEAEIRADLAQSEPRFVTFHDAYQYFERRFDLASSGTVSLGDASAPGPARLAELKARIAEQGIDCAFSEPQYDTRLISAATEGMDVQILVLDPIGATLEPGPTLYPDLLRAMAASFQACSGNS